jgi:hypothetical protein
MKERLMALLRKQWAGDATSEDFDEMANLRDALRFLSAKWAAQHCVLVPQRLRTDGEPDA